MSDPTDQLIAPLPPLLAPSTTAADWRDRLRPEFLAQFAALMYGPEPPIEAPKATTLAETKFEDATTLRTIRLHTGLLGPVTLQLTLPTATEKPAPCFVALNFNGNHETVAGDTAWSLSDAAQRGYAVATVCYEVLAVDRKDSPVYASPYRAVSLWAWGMSRIADYLLTLPEIAPDGLIALGHSRLGKATLLAGARDERFAVVMPHQSGCGGAAPSRGTSGEPVPRINAVFPHWFNDTYKTYSDHPETLPLDQHALIACCAPRPVLLTNATEDTWANPDGQVLALTAAEPVYALFGAAGRNAAKIRDGKHSLSADDWKLFFDFADGCFNPNN